MVHWKAWDLAWCKWYGIRGGWVLVSAGIEFIFFLATGTGLCFGFSMRVMLITHWYFGCYWTALTLSQELPSFPFLPVSRCSRSQREHAQDIWPELPKGIFHSTECDVQYTNCLELAGEKLADHCSGIGWASQGVRNCTMHQLFLLGFIPFSLSLWFLYYYNILFQLFNCS